MTQSDQTVRHLDHFVLVPEDIDTAATTYEALGFQVLPKMRHVNFGSCNQVIQLGDNYIELLGDVDLIEDPEHLEFYGRRKQLGSGMSNFSYSSDSLAKDQARLSASGVPFHPIKSASRPVQMPDGRTDPTESNFFYTVFEAAPYQTPFFSEHLKPETIFVPDYQKHVNTAQSVTGVICAALDPERDAKHLAALAGAVAKAGAPGVFDIALGRGHHAAVYSQDALSDRYGDLVHFNPETGGCAVGLVLSVADKTDLHTRLKSRDMPYDACSHMTRVAAASASGVMLEFHY